MSAQRFVELLVPIVIADQTAVPGTAEAVLWAPQFSALPANFFDMPGKSIRVRATGVFTSGVTPGTLILTPRYGTTTGGTSLGVGTASGTLVASMTNVPWELNYTLTCRTIGTSGTVAGYGTWVSPRGLVTAPSCVEVGLHAVTTIDTTLATGGMTIGATLSQAGSSLTTRTLFLEALS